MPKRRMKRHAVTQPLDPSYRLIPLTQHQNAIVYTADFAWLSQGNWHANLCDKGFYVRRTTRQRRIYMAAEILKCPDGILCDHVNRNTLDNRRVNLRRASPSENGSNRSQRSDNKSGFKGVSWSSERQKWVAQIAFGRVTIALGRFLDKTEAARAYDEAARKYHGQFAVLNFP